ncbi:hypothetical protein N7468_007313 [Penicillium chermesinum]|uniref:Uncharacterized protein n=1 Tax=Penicillium chermesinum TaxID=63820 RepID=A0A9W9NW94_9EURO|nr:uncharacterized protein N7468_007313 [Penicillium chermesinum]KAJ5226088.1 hypothetical protein N7468_007313 [Penicillium chermesinum]
MERTIRARGPIMQSNKTNPGSERSDRTQERTRRQRYKKKAVAYNRQVTDTFCTQANQLSVEEFITKEIARWRDKPNRGNSENALLRCTEMVFVEGKYQLLPAMHKLSDKHVYMMTKTLSAKIRCVRRWTEDFNATGDIQAERIPLDPSPLFYVFGVLCIALYRGYYILAGSRGPELYSVLANVKNNATIKAAQRDWLLGPILASEDFTSAQRNLTQIYHDETGERITTKVQAHGTIVSTDALLPNERTSQACKAHFDRIITSVFDLSLISGSDGKPSFARIIDHPAFTRKTHTTHPLVTETPKADYQSQGQALAIELLRETNPVLEDLINKLQTVAATTPAADYKAQFPALTKSLDLITGIQKDIQAVDERYRDALAT